MNSSKHSWELKEYETLPIVEDIDLDKLNKFLKINPLVKGFRDIQGDLYIKADSKVGVFNNSNFQIVVKPKIPAVNLFIMLNYAYEQKLVKLKDEALLESCKDDFQSIFIYWFLTELEFFLKKHYSIDFIQREEILNSRIKGKILFNDYVKNSIPRFKNERIKCQYYELTEDILENQIIKYAFSLVHRFSMTISNEVIKKRLLTKINKIVPYFHGVSNKKILLNDFNRIRYAGKYKNYKNIHEICKLIIKSIQINLSASNFEFKSFYLDMNELFERFVAGVVKAGNFLNNFNYQKEYSFKVADVIRHIKPDIILNDNQRTIIFDAKYKSVYEDDNADTIEVNGQKIKTSDIYQMIAYSNHYEILSDISFLVYPVEIKAVKISNFVKSDKEYYVIGIDVENIENGIKNFREQIEDINSTRINI